ncbi:hypothetical protein ABX022_09720 [Snodgrassella alvi]|uniref:hypothetical protein n=1 Tax=Snodgrassella alvi TaxID=1196083 RepID=UPI00345F62F9
MDIYNGKVRIVEKLINEEDLTRSEIIFLLENFKEVSKQEIHENYTYHTITVSILEVGEDLYYEVAWRFSRWKHIPHEFYSQPIRVKKTQDKIDVYIPYDD